MINSSLNGSNGLIHSFSFTSFPPGPVSAGCHDPRAIPLGKYRYASRRALAAVPGAACAPAPNAETGRMMSSNGNAMVAPIPRSTVRREMRRVVIGSVPDFRSESGSFHSDSLDHWLVK